MKIFSGRVAFVTGPDEVDSRNTVAQWPTNCAPYP
jgi:hypothetical protein